MRGLETEAPRWVVTSNEPVSLVRKVFRLDSAYFKADGSLDLVHHWLYSCTANHVMSEPTLDST